MNILILGTSNSVIKNGWVDGLKISCPDCIITNLSIGASPGIQFASKINLDYSLYDYVFFDSVPNDEDYQYSNIGYSDIEFTTTILKEIFTTISYQTQLIILGICNKANLHQESSIFSARRLLAEACDAYFIDFRYILKKYTDFFVCRSGSIDLYDTHPSHPLPEHMKYIGEVIGRGLSSLPPNKINSFNSYSQMYSMWTALTDAPADVSIVKKSNSFLTEFFANLEAGMTLDIPHEGDCIGFYVNYHETNACISILNSNNIELRALNVFSPPNDRFIKIFVPIPNGANMYRISISDTPRSDAYTPNMFSSTPQYRKPIALQVSHFIFRKPSQETTLIARTQRNSSNNQSNCLTTFICDEIDYEIDRVPHRPQEFMITDFFNRHLYFNIETNKCILLNPKTSIQSYSRYVPVKINSHNEVINFFIDISGSLFSLQAHSVGISITHNNMLNLPSNTSPVIGENFSVIKQINKGFALMCGETYLTALPDGSLICQRQVPNAWETFTFSS
ncbi:hypothetical protein [Pseudomonas syringae]|nr:hypothetical protein [Pseudomonas syringae]